MLLCQADLHACAALARCARLIWSQCQNLHPQLRHSAPKQPVTRVAHIGHGLAASYQIYQILGVFGATIELFAAVYMLLFFR